MVSIVRGPLAHCRDALEANTPDLDEYPSRTYEGRGVFELARGPAIPVTQGVNLVPQPRFQVEVGDRASAHCSPDVPGIVPFLGSAYQISAYQRTADPLPAQLGLPMLTADTGYMVRWMFGRDGDVEGGQRLWRRLDQDELDRIPDVVKPDPAVEPDARQAYQPPSGAVAAPEPVDFVAPRVGGLPYEPWMARSVNLATDWRVVVPNTSVHPMALVVPPTLVIVGQNFNVIQCPDGATAVGLSAVLSTPAALGYMAGIAPWSRGETPRPRSKHVYATLWWAEQEIADVLAQRAQELGDLAVGLDTTWSAHVESAIAIARGESATGDALRDRYVRMEPRTALDERVTGVVNVAGTVGNLLTEAGPVEIEFNSAAEAARAIVHAWSALPFDMSLDEVLAVRLPRPESDDPEAVRTVFQGAWSVFVDTI